MAHSHLRPGSGGTAASVKALVLETAAVRRVLEELVIRARNPPVTFGSAEDAGQHQWSRFGVNRKFGAAAFPLANLSGQ